MDDSSGGQDWTTALLTGVSAVVDSQLANQFGVNTGLPNMGYGQAGQAQSNVRPVLSATSPVLLLGIGLAAVVLLVLVLKK